MRQIIGILVLLLMQVLAEQLPTSSNNAMTPNPTICGEIVNNEGM